MDGQDADSDLPKLQFIQLGECALEGNDNDGLIMKGVIARNYKYHLTMRSETESLD